MSQLEQFKTVVNGESVWLSGSPVMLGLVALTIASVVFLPVTKAVPVISSYYCGFGLVLGLGIETKTVADIAS
jgi:SulP family sulfate permease